MLWRMWHSAKRVSAMRLLVTPLAHPCLLVYVPAVILILVAPTHQPSSFVWFAWNPNSDINGIDSSVYIVLVGLLFSQWVIMSFDTCTNMCEETIDGDRASEWCLALHTRTALHAADKQRVHVQPHPDAHNTLGCA